MIQGTTDWIIFSALVVSFLGLIIISCGLVYKTNKLMVEKEALQLENSLLRGEKASRLEQPLSTLIEQTKVDVVPEPLGPGRHRLAGDETEMFPPISDELIQSDFYEELAASFHPGMYEIHGDTVTVFLTWEILNSIEGAEMLRVLQFLSTYYQEILDGYSTEENPGKGRRFTFKLAKAEARE